MKKFFKGYMARGQELVQKMGVVKPTFTKEQVLTQLSINEQQLKARVASGSIYQFQIDGQQLYQINI